ncbi:MAG: LytTR family transcriptional regulator [Bacteroidales bacterium]|nr:LytTR family transcriptional regulator [Bacteroidales bacterium]
MSKTISRVFYRMPVNTLFFVVVPLFYFVFVLLWEPFQMDEFLAVGKDRYTLNLIVTTLILLGTMTISRMLLFILRNVLELNWPLYILWSAGELVIAGLLFTIPLGIGWGAERSYFSVMTSCIGRVAGICVFPELILAMAVQMQVMAKRSAAPSSQDDKTLVRFLDNEKRLKLIVSSQSIYYIEAQENYVHIVHLDSGKVKNFELRASMASLEEVLTKQGMIRCHRSFFVNPAHVELLRKDSAGYAIAQLDREGLKDIPVSKKYYEAVAALL